MASPQSAALFLQIFSEGQYPIFSGILKHLHQFDINNLRGICRTLRNSLAPSYPHLVGSCQAMYPWHAARNGSAVIDLGDLARNAPRYRCPAGPTWPGIVRACRGDAYKFSRHGDLSNGGEYWICKKCQGGWRINDLEGVWGPPKIQPTYRAIEKPKLCNCGSYL